MATHCSKGSTVNCNLHQMMLSMTNELISIEVQPTYEISTDWDYGGLGADPLCIYDSFVGSHNAVSNISWPNLYSRFSIFHFLFHMKCVYWLGILSFHFLLLFDMPAMSKIPLPQIPDSPRDPPTLLAEVGEVFDRCTLWNHISTIYIFLLKNIMFLQIINAFVFKRITPTPYTPQCKIPMASSRILEWGEVLGFETMVCIKKHQIHFNSIKLYEIFSVISAKVKLSKNIPWTLTTTQDLTYTKSIPCFIFFLPISFDYYPCFNSSSMV